MSEDGSRRASWLPIAGVATLATTAIGGFTATAQAAPAAPVEDPDGTSLQHEGADSHGTYESCAAYFGLGKDDFSAIDIVGFDVADESGTDGATHGVGADTHVVFVLTNELGETLECEPEEVTQEAWDTAMDDLYLTWTEGQPAPAWPGPGHYPYPSIAFDPFVEDFGEVVDVAFRVTGVPAGHELISPTGLHTLDQHHIIGWDGYATTADPRVLDLVEERAGADARAAFASVLAACEEDSDADFSSDAVLALDALTEFRGLEPEDEPACWNLTQRNAEVSFVLGLQVSISYSEPIRLALPAQETTTTTTTAPAGGVVAATPTTTPAPAATPVSATPRFTG